MADLVGGSYAAGDDDGDGGVVFFGITVCTGDDLLDLMVVVGVKIIVIEVGEFLVVEY